jgi:hypothetical protein
LSYTTFAAFGMYLFDAPSLALCTLGSITVGGLVYGVTLWLIGGLPPSLFARLAPSGR